MDLVLGLSITPAGVRYVLVEGSTGEGVIVDRGDHSAQDSADDVVEALVGEPSLVAASDDNNLYAVGLTWSAESAEGASAVLEALAVRNIDNVISVSEAESVAALAGVIGALTGYHQAAVCMVEADGAQLATVGTEEVFVEPVGGDDLAATLTAKFAESPPEAVIVVGAGADLDRLVSALDEAVDAPVMSAVDADVALARGTALAAAQETHELDADVARSTAVHRAWLPTRTDAVQLVLVAAVLAFVVSISALIGLRFSPADESPDAPSSAPPTAVAAPPAAPPPLDMRPLVAKTLEVAVPEAAPEAPAYEPAPESEPGPVYEPPAAPAPVYTPPAPVYVPPPPQPRLRDRIIERLPLINRFHEPNQGWHR